MKTPQQYVKYIQFIFEDERFSHPQRLNILKMLDSLVNLVEVTSLSVKRTPVFRGFTITVGSSAFSVLDCRFYCYIFGWCLDSRRKNATANVVDFEYPATEEKLRYVLRQNFIL